jgi:tRNA threonylcarbamoyladenosine biosynthesis protein TsaE
MVEIIENQLSLNCRSLKDLPDIARQILDFTGRSGIIAFEGQLGAGKTTLIKQICWLLGVQDTISSPSFSIINEYVDGEGKTVYHFDFYRIKDVEEAFGTGAEEYFFSGSLCLVEWPEIAKELMPDDHFLVQIEVNGPESRIFQVKKYDRRA